MLSKLRVGIICGGCSLEHEVSLKSAAFIAQTIDKNIFEIIVLYIHKNGNWYIVNKFSNFLPFFNHNENIPIFFKKTNKKFRLCYKNINNLLRLDVIFPIIHGELGEDGSLQGFLRVMNLPYVGSDVLGSAICINKDITKCLLRDSGLPIIPFKTFLNYDRQKIDFYGIANKFGLPLFIKPINQGSSIGVSKVNTNNDFKKAIDIAFSYSNKIIIEPCIVGRELECAVLGGGRYLEVSICGEIIVKKNNFYTYLDKYTQYNSQIVIPALIDNNISDKIQEISIRVFQVLNCFGMARVDLFLTMNNQIFINEVNTLPGFTNNSMYSKLWEKTGLQPKLLITKLIKLALNRYEIDLLQKKHYKINI